MRTQAQAVRKNPVSTTLNWDNNRDEARTQMHQCDVGLSCIAGDSDSGSDSDQPLQRVREKQGKTSGKTFATKPTTGKPLKAVLPSATKTGTITGTADVAAPMRGTLKQIREQVARSRILTQAEVHAAVMEHDPEVVQSSEGEQQASQEASPKASLQDNSSANLQRKGLYSEIKRHISALLFQLKTDLQQ